MSRLTGSDALGLYEAYQAVYNPQELTEEQVWEGVEEWVNALIEEGYADTEEAALVIMATMSEEMDDSSTCSKNVLLEYQSISPIVSILFLKKNHFQVKREMGVDTVLMRSSKNQMIKSQNQALMSQHLR
jgi:hypothetical protein